MSLDDCLDDIADEIESRQTQGAQRVICVGQQIIEMKTNCVCIVHVDTNVKKGGPEYNLFNDFSTICVPLTPDNLMKNGVASADALYHITLNDMLLVVKYPGSSQPPWHSTVLTDVLKRVDGDNHLPNGRTHESDRLFKKRVGILTRLMKNDPDTLKSLLNLGVNQALEVHIPYYSTSNGFKWSEFVSDIDITECLFTHSLDVIFVGVYCNRKIWSLWASLV